MRTSKSRWFVFGVMIAGLASCLRAGKATGAANGSGGDEGIGSGITLPSGGINGPVNTVGTATSGTTGETASGAAGSSSGSGSPDVAADLAQWNELSMQLDTRRSVFLATSVDALQTLGNQLFWQDTTNLTPVLNRYDDTTKTKRTYTFLADSFGLVYRASANLVIVADELTSPATFYAYDADTGTEIDNTLKSTPAGAYWSTFAVSGGIVYLVDATVAGTTTLYQWVPGHAPIAMTTLESAGAQIGEFEAFGVDGTTMVFTESGRIWKMDLASNKAVWLMNQTQVTGSVDFESDGVLFATSTGLIFFDYAKGTVTNESDLINQNPYRVNETFASYSKYPQYVTRWKNYLVYVAVNGLFGYDMVKDTITPILLSPLSTALRVDYRTPVVLADGMAFVIGLTSNDGAVGADGPTYQIDLTAILK